MLCLFHLVMVLCYENYAMTLLLSSLYISMLSGYVSIPLLKEDIFVPPLIDVLNYITIAHYVT